MVPDAPIFDSQVNLAHQLDVMVATGVESLRINVNWAAMEPYQSWSDVPPSSHDQFTDVQGIPINFADTDKIVGLAAQRSLSILPVVLVTPNWAAATVLPTQYNLPRSNSTYARFLGALVSRYGPHGSFWRDKPQIRRRPIRMWEIWNEPNLKLYWPSQPFARPYVAMLRAARAAIKRVDSGAKIVLAGMANFVWKDLASIYAVAGARRLFDVVAVHPFTTQPAGVITILESVRDVMNGAGDSRKPIIASEVSWPASLGKSISLYGFETTEIGQAEKLAALLPMLATNRQQLRLIGFDYYTWVGGDVPGIPFSFAGLFRFTKDTFVAKPAYAAFRQAALAIEGVGSRRQSRLAVRRVSPRHTT